MREKKIKRNRPKVEPLGKPNGREELGKTQGEEQPGGPDGADDLAVPDYVMRDFSSVGGIEAGRYDVMVDEEVAEEASRLIPQLRQGREAQNES